MCVFLGKAETKNEDKYGSTITGLSESFLNKKYYHTFFYQNNPINLSKSGANCMILHIPAKSLVPENFISTKDIPNICKDMVDAISPSYTQYSLDLQKRMASRSIVYVFNVDIYTIVLADNANDIPAALERVPLNRRPTNVNPEIYKFYQNTFPNWKYALCCFDNKDATSTPLPLLFYYEPLFGNRFIAPGLDSHDGNAPTLNKKVEVDHWLIIGSYERKHSSLAPVHYKQGHIMSNTMRDILPSFVMGKRLYGQFSNGDFLMEPQNLISGLPFRIERGISP